MTIDSISVDVLCIGHASYDLIFSVVQHPSEDEKIFATQLISCGGGPAANAAVAIARLGYTAAFAGYLGNDVYGDAHLQELIEEGVNTDLIIRGTCPTPLSTILVKPDGKRALINYKGGTQPLPAEAIDFSAINPKVMLFDGHEPEISMPLAEAARTRGIATLLDAGSVHKGTLALMDKVDYLVCSEKFAQQVAGDTQAALEQLAALSANVVITLGEQGLIWQRGAKHGTLPAILVQAIDTTGAGDAFHGALAVAVACDMGWLEALGYASAAGSLCCTKMGARSGLPTRQEHEVLMNTYSSNNP
jgi:sulfofructose kinase